ncbi:pirin family protein [Paraburkholderia ultramafica]|nr:pirin family protein [Paraburkholderia ultramafica]
MSKRGASFAAARIDLAALHDFVNPVVGLDHFRMSGPTFAPHPHAGFSAISYMFDDSAGAMHNRDSLGNDFIAGPGDVIWTQAGSGMIHDELPAQNGREVHGIQLFVNQTSANKRLDPEVFWLKRNDVPVIDDGTGNRIRVVVGEHEGKRSPLVPAEPFLLLDGEWCVPTDLPLNANWNTIVYVLEGELRLDADGKAIQLRPGHTLGIRSDDAGSVRLEPSAPTHMLVLAGPAIDEPMVTNGPFIMNSAAQIEEAVARFKAGKMGRLQAIGTGQRED